MRCITVCAAIVFALAGTTGGQEKKTESTVVKVDAMELAKEFETDAKEARKKYDPKVADIEIFGLVANVKGGRANTVTFDTKTKVSVVVQAKKVAQPDQKSKKIAAEATGKFRSFDRNTVVIDSNEVKLLRIVEEKKK